ncbi:MAG TPA: hypothetical protein ENJ28_04885 [Gammaproteobacteria bacterium]|nr:hypothetical protein [Gammaproteobacteria bacterium]
MTTLAKYGQSKTITFELFNQDGLTFQKAATFSAGDVVIMKDEGAEANTANLPTDEGRGYSLVLTAAEMTAARIRIYIEDASATQVWLDTSIDLETYGNASAEHAFDLDTATVTLAAVTHTGAVIPTVTTLTGHTPQTGDNYARLGAPAGVSISADIADVPTVAEFNARTILAASYFDPSTDTVTVGTNNDKSGYSLTQTFPANFSDMSITVTTGQVTVGTNNDKTGYSISGTKQTLDALNDIAATAIVSGGAINTTSGAVDNVTTVATTTTNTDMRGTDGANTTTPPTAAAIADSVWDEIITGAAHNTTNSAGYRIKRTSDLMYNNSTVNDASATTLTFVTALTETDTDFFKGQLCVFTSGSLIGQARVVDAYNGTTKAFTFLDGYTQAPANGDSFLMYITHLHSSEEIAQQTRTEMDANSTQLAKLGTPAADVSADIAAVKAETASIQAETTPIKTKTDQLTFTKSNELDANTKSINSATVTGDGNATPWDGI